MEKSHKNAYKRINKNRACETHPNFSLTFAFFFIFIRLFRLKWIGDALKTCEGFHCEEFHSQIFSKDTFDPLQSKFEHPFDTKFLFY